MTNKLEHIKVLTDPTTGKQRYQARVYYRRQFIASGVFDTVPLARVFYKTTYEAAVRGEAEPAADRRQQRQAESTLDQPMSEWAAKFVQSNPLSLTKGRLNEYLLVGRLLGNLKLRDFQGKAGGQLIQELHEKWRFMHFKRGMRDKPEYKPHDEISPQSLRLRLSALEVLIKFSADKLPDSVKWEAPIKPFGYKQPPAHRDPRTRLPSDEEFTKLLHHFGVGSDMGEFLQIIDETGCRLSEIRKARKKDIKLFNLDGNVGGGVLELLHHKTEKNVGKRDVPLSRHAAEILEHRIETYGDGPLFSGLSSTKSLGKDLKAACTELGIDGLQIKDFRRAFITRSASVLSSLERAKIFGASSLIDSQRLDSASEAVKVAVGHSRLSTTLGYFVPDVEKIAVLLTKASRWSQISAMLTTTAATSTASSSSTLTCATDAGVKGGPSNSKGTSEEASGQIAASLKGEDLTVQSTGTDITTRCPSASKVIAKEETTAWTVMPAIQGVTDAQLTVTVSYGEQSSSPT